jgi:bifunctional DNase/RNase
LIFKRFKNSIKIVISITCSINEIFINNLSEGTFFARIKYKQNGHELEQDARPSDAIAMAVRFKAPIFVDDSVLDEAGIVSDDDSSSQAAKIQKSGTTKSMSKMEKLENELQTAIETENYEKAARLRDQINKLKG